MSDILGQIDGFLADAEADGAFTANDVLEVQAAMGKDLEVLTAEEIKKIRGTLRLSQTAFALLINVSKSAVQKWERGAKFPNGAALKLLRLVKGLGLSVTELRTERQMTIRSVAQTQTIKTHMDCVPFTYSSVTSIATYAREERA